MGFAPLLLHKAPRTKPASHRHHLCFNAQAGCFHLGELLTPFSIASSLQPPLICKGGTDQLQHLCGVFAL